jgi:hypothetical protein
MAGKRRNLFLYLTLACFLGLIAIFIFDGYMGLYDTMRINAGEFEQKIEPDFWLQQDSDGRLWSTGITRGETAFFRYEIDNRRFSAYQANLDVSVWRSQEKVQDLVSQQVSIPAFDKREIEWAVDTAEFAPADAPLEQRYNYTVIIKLGEIERRTVLYINYPYEPQPPRVIPTPPGRMEES